MEAERIDLEPGLLSVSVFEHEVQLRERSAPCWTCLTAGLETAGQAEIALTIVRPHTAAAVFPNTVLEYLWYVRKWATEGHVVGVGGISGFDSPGPFELGEFVGIAYSSRQVIAGVPLPERCLAGVFVTEPELDMAKRTCVNRVLSKLGEHYRYFPWPYWSEPSRPSVYRSGDAARSVLARGIARIGSPTATATFDSHEIRLELPPSTGAKVAEALNSKRSVAVLVNRDPRVRAAMVWEPAQSEPTAIWDEVGPSSPIALWFMALISSEQHEDDIRLLEDGGAALLTKRTTERLTKSLVDGTEFRVGGGTPELVLTVTANKTEPFDS